MKKKTKTATKRMRWFTEKLNSDLIKEKNKKTGSPTANISNNKTQQQKIVFCDCFSIKQKQKNGTE